MLRGSIVALVTPMLASGEVDWTSLANLVNYHVNAGTTAIVAVGTSGESVTLNEEEHIAVVEQAVAYAAGRIPVIAGCGSNNTAHAIALTRRLAKTGVVAGLSVTPYYNKPTQEGLYRHYCAIAEASGLPQILYNVPGRTCCDLKPETVVRLANVAGIIGLKEATGDISRVSLLRQLCGPEFALYSGDDATGCDFMLQGGDGVISVTTNIAAAQMADMCRAALTGAAEQAHDLNNRLMPLHHALFCEPSPTPVKWACATLGLIATTTLRLPLVDLTAEGKQTMMQALTTAELMASV
ncbi:4-hydroxy-tetrahydrodipicolinate synthase [Aeromonas cavernicola]|uniref:4-hydroxy-tetrahydrodipicolinate synthase n=1 Tax=Aeromonas cavernicola TaxID=1006623 RepID=A0A2H9U5K1_9GAMM|nr:4-hydroxy-tetrahydrodipicolinate synthase [Aeromonas cavernicola]PJG59307.1 4-hydroxy-tetrahydrodipicolinate synthase [Aeromonas cavernicola]